MCKLFRYLFVFLQSLMKNCYVFDYNIKLIIILGIISIIILLFSIVFLMEVVIIYMSHIKNKFLYQ